MGRVRTLLRRLARGPGTALLLVATALYGLNLRGPIVAIAPVIDDARSALGVGRAAAGLLTSLPVACFAVVAPLASVLIARAGIERAIALSLAAILLGTLVRAAGGFGLALAGTVIIGSAITIGNVAVPVLIGRDFGPDAAIVTALYAAVLNIGAMVTSVLTAPLAGLIGWRAAITAWGALAVVAGAAWARWSRVAALRAPAGPSAAAGPAWPTPPVVAPALWRRPFVWGLTAAFGAQAFSYYGVTAWLPTLLRDEIGLGASVAGASASIFQITAVAGAFGVPALLHRRLSPSAVLLIVCALWITLPLGLLTAPGAWPLWCALGGAAQGGGFTAIFSAVVRRAVDQRDSRRISAAVQGGGYAIAAIGPAVVGAVHDATGGWSAPLVAVAGVIAVMALAGSAGCRAPRTG